MFNPKQAQNRHQINTQYTKPSYFLCNRFKLPRLTNYTQKDIRAIVGQINGQYRKSEAERLSVLKNKKNQKKISYKNREKTA